MPERYPADNELLASTQDPGTGVEYIPNGKSPYFLEFRRLVQRTLLAAARANDLRVFVDGDLTVGVRAGDYVIADTPIHFAGAEHVTVPPAATTHLYFDAAGELQLGDALPEQRWTHLPLATVVADATRITAIVDLRGQAFLHVPSLAAMGVSATAARINAALADADDSVTAAALATLTASADSNADALHTHTRLTHTIDGESLVTLANDSHDLDANIALAFSTPNRSGDDVALLPDPTDGLLTQRIAGVTRRLLSATHISAVRPGTLTSSASSTLACVVPFDGRVLRVDLSAGTNLQSSNTFDAVSAVVRVNGSSLTTTPPTLRASDGGGFRSTARGQGVAAAIDAAVRDVHRGDLVTVGFDIAAAGAISVSPSDLAALVVLRPTQSE